MIQTGWLTLQGGLRAYVPGFCGTFVLEQPSHSDQSANGPHLQPTGCTQLPGIRTGGRISSGAALGWLKQRWAGPRRPSLGEHLPCRRQKGDQQRHLQLQLLSSKTGNSSNHENMTSQTERCRIQLKPVRETDLHGALRRCCSALVPGLQPSGSAHLSAQDCATEQNSGIPSVKKLWTETGSQPETLSSPLSPTLRIFPVN